MRPCRILFLISFSPNNFNIHYDSCLNELLLWWWLNDFLHHSFYFYCLVFYSKKELSPLPIYLYIPMWTQGSLFYLMGYNSLLLWFIWMLRLPQIWTMGALLNWLLCYFDMFPYSLSTKCFKLILFFGPVLESTIFSKEHWLPYFFKI